MSPSTCPKCGGQGTVQKPPWVAGDQTGWVSSTTSLLSGCYICKPSEHIHDDPNCEGCKQGCDECFNDYLAWIL